MFSFMISAVRFLPLSSSSSLKSLLKIFSCMFRYLDFCSFCIPVSFFTGMSVNFTCCSCCFQVFLLQPLKGWNLYG
jgi:hypothetical protein